MRQRLLRIGILAGVLFAINVVGRLVVRLGSVEDPTTQSQVSLATFGAIALAMGGTAVAWGRLRPLGVVTGELAAGAGAGGVLILLVGPFVSGSTLAGGGAGELFTQAWQYAGFAAGGALVGTLLLTMVGRDYKSQSLKRFAQEKLTKPRRPVRR
jgi:hypothetical protein